MSTATLAAVTSFLPDCYHPAMIRTQISLTQDQMQRAKRAAARRGVSLAALIRQALERELSHDAPPAEATIASQLRGRYRSGRSDVAEHHDDHLGADERGW